MFNEELLGRMSESSYYIQCHLYPPQGNIFVVVVSIHETMIPPTNKVIGPNYLDVRRISYWGQAFKPDLNINTLITLTTPEFDINKKLDDLVHCCGCIF